jgi:hypothetical protein
MNTELELLVIRNKKEKSVITSNGMTMMKIYDFTTTSQVVHHISIFLTGTTLLIFKHMSNKQPYGICCIYAAKTDTEPYSESVVTSTHFCIQFLSQPFSFLFSSMLGLQSGPFLQKILT